MPGSKFRADITVIGVPLTAITNSTYTDPRQRQLFKNIIYLGALCALLEMDPKLIEQLIRSEEHTSELQSPCNLVCRLLLEQTQAPLTPRPTAPARCRRARSAPARARVRTAPASPAARSPQARPSCARRSCLRSPRPRRARR